MATSCPVPRILVGIVVAGALGLVGLAASSGRAGWPVAPGPNQAAVVQGGSQAGAAAAAPKKDKVAKLAEPWPSAEKLRERRIEAEQRALFAGTEPVEFTLRADIRALNRDRDPESTKRFPGTLVVTDADGQPRQIDVQVGTRGRARLSYQLCAVVPLRIEFAKKKQTARTVFEGQDELKLVTHCENASLHEQYVLREYLAYRVFNVVTPRSYRVRLARAVYVQAGSDAKAPASRWAMFVEDDGDLARRMEGRVAALQNRLFRRLNQDSLIRMTLLLYFIADTDISILKLHNARLVQDASGSLHPVAYDFDYAGLVDAHYALADKRLGIGSVRERLYRGPCLPLATLEPYFEEFRARKAELLGLYDSLPALNADYARDSKKYIEEFYKTVASPKASKRAFVDDCQHAAGM